MRKLLWTVMTVTILCSLSSLALAEKRVFTLRHADTQKVTLALLAAIGSPEVAAELGGAPGGVRFDPRRETNELVVEAQPATLAVVAALLAGLDQPTRQVKIDVLFVETSAPERFLGPAQLIAPVVTLPSGRTMTLPISQAQPFGPQAPATFGQEDPLASLVASAGQPLLVNAAFEMGTLDAALQDGVAKVVSYPRVTAEEGATAVVDVSPQPTGEAEPQGEGAADTPESRVAVRCQPLLMPDGRIALNLVIAWHTVRALRVVVEDGRPIAIGLSNPKDDPKTVLPALCIIKAAQVLGGAGG